MFKRPVIASNIGAMNERITDGVDGLHFDVGDAGSLAAAMRRAFGEPGLWKRLSMGIAAHPHRSVMVKAFYHAYHEDVSVGLEAMQR